MQPLGAWLYKKHAGGGSVLGGKWGKRWVHVNDERGRLHIGKKKGKDGTTVVRRARARMTTISNGRINPLTVLTRRTSPFYSCAFSQFSLSEVSSIRPLEPTAKEADGEMFCFLVSQAPIQCVLRCKNEEERKKWLDALAERSDEWRQKRRGEMTNSGCARLSSRRAHAPSAVFLFARSHARVVSLCAAAQRDCRGNGQDTGVERTDDRGTGGGNERPDNRAFAACRRLGCGRDRKHAATRGPAVACAEL